MILGPDLSHYQTVNFAQVAASGQAFVVLKATEGTTYTDPTFAARRQQAHAAGLIVGFYHFARAGNAAAEATWFLRNVGPLQPGEFLVLDWEVPAPAGGAPAWCKAWLDAVYAATSVRPLIYMNQTAATVSNWASVAADCGLWLARYDNSTAQPTVPGWSVAMKQFSDKGTVPGVGTCDVNAFYGSTAQLLAYGKGGTPTPQEDDMTPDQAKTLDGLAWTLGQMKPTLDTLGAALSPQAVADAVWQGTTVARADASTGGKLQQIPALQELADAKTAALAADAVAAPVIDEAKLAAALLADPAAVQALGKAIADNLQLSPRG